MGYTPEAQLAAWLGRRDTSIVTGTSTHTLDLYYVVAMPRREFEALLGTVDATIYPSYGSREHLWEDFIAFIGKENGVPPAPRYRVNSEDTFSWLVSKVQKVFRISFASNCANFTKLQREIRAIREIRCPVFLNTFGILLTQGSTTQCRSLSNTGSKQWP